MTRSSAQQICVPTGSEQLHGTLRLPLGVRGVVLLALRSVASDRARHLVAHLESQGLGTLLVPLLTREEEELDSVTAEHRFNVRLLGARILDQITAVEAAIGSKLNLGILASSTAAAGALVAAARRPEAIQALVLQGGRPELAVFALPEVCAPTLFLVGGEDEPGIHSNQIAALRLHAPHRLEVIDGANHRFQEPGKLEEVARLTNTWFQKHLIHPPPAEQLRGPESAWRETRAVDEKVVTKCH